jgi:hypothetical protein
MSTRTFSYNTALYYNSKVGEERFTVGLCDSWKLSPNTGATSGNFLTVGLPKKFIDSRFHAALFPHPGNKLKIL